MNDRKTAIFFAVGFAVVVGGRFFIRWVADNNEALSAVSGPDLGVDPLWFLMGLGGLVIAGGVGMLAMNAKPTPPW